MASLVGQARQRNETEPVLMLNMALVTDEANIFCLECLLPKKQLYLGLKA